MQSHVASPKEIRKTSRWKLWLLLAICAAPVVASYVAYNFWRPSAHVNYGTLLTPHPLPDVDLVTRDGKAFRLSALKGEWVLLSVAASRCDKSCEDRLVYMRQVRLAQGKESERIERVLLLTDSGAAADTTVLSEHPGLHVLRDPEKALAATFPAVRAPEDHIYVVDPLGNLMMRFPADPDPRRMLKDMSRLLRHSKWK